MWNVSTQEHLSTETIKALLEDLNYKDPETVEMGLITLGENFRKLYSTLDGLSIKVSPELESLRGVPFEPKTPRMIYSDLTKEAFLELYQRSEETMKRRQERREVPKEGLAFIAAEWEEGEDTLIIKPKKIELQPHIGRYEEKSGFQEKDIFNYLREKNIPHETV